MPSTEEEEWLLCAAQMAAAGRAAAQPLQGTAMGQVVHGRGAGGDRTLEIDRACEAAIQEALEAKAPAAYQLISEESGAFGSPDARWKVVVDPLDGSLNAKRGLQPFGVSIAIADGSAIGDVRVAYIRDYLGSHVYTAIRGLGLLGAILPAGEMGGRVATTDGGGIKAVGFELDSSRFRSDLVELVLLEAGRPDRNHFRYSELGAMGAAGRSQDMRVRQIGSLALSLCYVAVGVADVLVAAVRSRAVDIAAGLLILREAGGGAVTLTGEDMSLQPLDLEKRCGFVAWRAGLDGTQIMARTGDLRAALSGSD